MKLDLVDQNIISELDRDARQPASAIAKKLKIAKETVNFRIKRLLANKVIKGFYPLLDTGKLGLFFVKIFLKFREIPPARRDAILGFLASHPRMSQVLLLEGKYDVQLFLLVCENRDTLAFLEHLNTFCGKDIQDKELLLVTSMHRFNLRFFKDAAEEQSEIVESGKEGASLEGIPLKLLRLLSANARIPLLELASKLDISPQLAGYHLKKLIREKVIVGTHVAINYDLLEKMHYHLTFRVNTHASLPSILEFFRASRTCIFATKMIGAYDGSAEILVDSSQELRELLDNFRKRFSESVNRLDVLLIYKEYELNLYPI